VQIHQLVDLVLVGMGGISVHKRRIYRLLSARRWLNAEPSPFEPHQSPAP
jgi:hypothetical protein